MFVTGRLDIKYIFYIPKKKPQKNHQKTKQTDKPTKANSHAYELNKLVNLIKRGLILIKQLSQS